MKRAFGVAPVVAVAIACVAVHERFVLRPRPITRAVGAYAVALHRARLAGEAVPSAPRDPVLRWTPPAPVAASLFRGGRARARVVAAGPLGRALARTASALARAAGPEGRGTIRIEIPTARQAFIGVQFIDAVSIAPAVDGVGAVRGERTEYASPFDLLAARAYEKHWVHADLRVGQEITIRRAKEIVGERLETGARGLDASGLFRLRVATFVEGSSGTLAAVRHHRPTRDALLSAGRLGASYLVGQLGPEGRYRYAYDPLADGDAEEGYNVPRHSGTTYFLAQAAGYLEEPAFARAARRALEYLWRTFVRRDDRTGTLVAGMGDRVDTGSASLAAVAMAEYRRVTDDTRYDAVIAGLCDFLLEMQRPDGDFTHRYHVDTGRRDPARLLYFTGEAALALLKAHEELGDPKYLRAAERALDWLTNEGWSFFGAEYVAGEEHWTCISANEAYPRIRKRAYLDFCRRWAAHRRAKQLFGTVFDGAGGYGMGTPIVPNTTPSGSTSEATISTALLARKWATPDRAIEAQTRRAASFLLRRQLDGPLLHLFPDPGAARGGFPTNEVDLDVRIDFVQHAASALIRLTDLDDGP